VTSLAFAPLNIPESNSAILAIGLENGLIELWRIYLGESPGPSPEVLICFSPQLCHIATVTKLAWRPNRVGVTSECEARLVLASSSVDHGCRIFDIIVPGTERR
jgi:hypothetical protein